jgi:hypothetical protein
MRKMGPLKKFPVSVPPDLHTRFKLQCVSKGVAMSEVVRALLERECQVANTQATKTTRPTKTTSRNDVCA